MSCAHFQVHTVVPVMKMPRIWLKKEPSGLMQIAFLIELQTVATYAEDLRLASIWWPYGSAVIGAKLQVCIILQKCCLNSHSLNITLASVLYYRVFSFCIFILDLFGCPGN